MNFRIPAHIDPSDRSLATCCARADRAQAMMNLRPNGDGFRRIPVGSAQNSMVEKHLIEAGDMEPNKITPSKRSLRKAEARVKYLEKARANPSKARGRRVRPLRGAGV